MRGGPIRILLGNRSLTRLTLSFAGVTVAEWGYVTALSVDAFRKDGAIAVGLVGLRLFVAAASSLASVGVMQRLPGRRLLTEIAGIRAIGVAASALLAAIGAPLTLLLVLLGVDALVSAQYRPAQSALIPYLARTPTELVASATGLSTVKTLSQAFGSVMGGLLLELVTPAPLFGGVAVIFAVTAFASRSFRQGQSAPTAIAPVTGLRGALRQTVRVFRYPHIGGILVVSGLRTFVRGMWIAIAVIASLRLLHAGSAGVGLLSLAAGVGSLVAAPLSSRLVSRSRLGTPAAAALVAGGAPLAIIAGVPVLSVAMALVAAWGVGMAVADVATSSLLNRLVEAPVVPRVTGTIESTKLALEGLGAFLAPLLVSAIGVRGALLIAAFPLPAVVIVGWKGLHRVDATAAERAGVLNLLHRVPCFEPLDLPTLDGLIGRLTALFFPNPGTEVIYQGDDGDRLFLIEEGTAEVVVDGFVVGVVGPGQSFGERALLRNVPRTATVRTREPMRVFALSREDFLVALTGQDELPQGSTDAPAVTDDAEWTHRQRVKLLSRLNLLSNLDPTALGKLAERSVIDQWPEGASIVCQGDEGDRFFVMLEGKAQVRIDTKPVGEVHPGDQFGEIALLHGVTRSADVVTLTPARTLSLQRDDFLPAVRSRLVLG